MRRAMALVLLAFPALGLAGTGYEYGGFRLDTDPGTFPYRYPTSTVRGSSVHLSKADSHDDIHYVEKRTVDGRAMLRIVFELPEYQLGKKPRSWKADWIARLPKCATILSRLVRVNREPVLEPLWTEERLYHRARTWSSPDETMSLDCYKLDGKGVELAAELILRSTRRAP